MYFLLIIKQLEVQWHGYIVSNCVFFNGLWFYCYFDNLASVVAVETEKAVYQLDGGLSPGFFNLHEKGSLGKILNSELPLM